MFDKEDHAMKWMVASLSLLLAAGWGVRAGAQEPLRGAADITASMGPLSAANGRFAIDLYRELERGTDGNLFLSPYSISAALAMTWAGARGQTAGEMAHVLHFAGPPEKIHSAMHELRDTLETAASKDSIDLSVANRLWGDRSKTFHPDFLDETKRDYGAGLEQVDFLGDADRSRQTINRWVEDRTHGRITDLLAEGSVTDLTRLVLTNAIYFKGRWEKPFEKTRTKNEPFHTSPTKDVTAPMMHASLRARFAKAGEAGLLLLPYRGDHLSMAILLPDRVDGIAAIEKRLTWQKLDAWIGNASFTEVVLSMPRFRTTSEFSLGETLMKMGMASAFDPARADFSGMDGARDLFISLVVHKAFVEVGEEGTEAAAATGVGMLTSDYKASKPEPVRFIVDHPFLFLIRDNASGAILFMGRIMNPLT
jgi:serpin B